MDTGKPLPSSDGRSVFFLGSDGLNGQLSRYDSKSHQWTPYLSGIPSDQVDFSRDGEWITYVSLFPENLIRRKVDGSQQLQLTYPPVKTSKPRWSPDGRMIAFMAQHPGKPWKICLVSADGGSARQLLNGDLDEWNPGWSPDGHSLVFQSDEIRILDLRTNQVRPIPDSKNCDYPRWSHDGRYLAATADSYKKVALFDFKLQKWVELIKGGDFYYPSWSRDEQYVYFIDWRTSAYCRVGIRDHKLDRVADLGSVGIQGGTDGTWVGLGPDDSPMAVLVLREIYALSWDAP
jgi:Tol biopolymer transport system component